MGIMPGTVMPIQQFQQPTVLVTQPSNDYGGQPPPYGGQPQPYGGFWSIRRMNVVDKIYWNKKGNSAFVISIEVHEGFLS